MHVECANTIQDNMERMDNRVFDFFYNRFKDAEADTKHNYTIAGVSLTALAAVGGGIAAAADADLFRRGVTQMIHGLYPFALGLNVIAWVFGAFHLERALRPRSTYPNIKRLKVWEQRLEQLQSNDNDDNEIETFFKEVRERLAEAETIARDNNEDRMKQAQKAVRFIGIALILLAVTMGLRFSASVIDNTRKDARMADKPQDDKKIDTQNDIETRSGKGTGIVQR